MSQKILEWKIIPWPYAEGYPDVWAAKVGRGCLYLQTWDNADGVAYTSSFGANSDKSFNGFLPGVDIEEAKRIVLADAQRHW